MAASSALDFEPTSGTPGNPLECPVCLEIFENPKSLPCGHSVCARCCESLMSTFKNIFIECPKCRTMINIPKDGLPTNYALKDDIEQQKLKLEKRKAEFPYVCTECVKSMTVDDAQLCNECKKILCALCILKSHRTHDFDGLQIVLNKRNEELAATLLKVDELKQSFCRAERAKFDDILEHLQVTIDRFFSMVPIIHNVCPTLEAELSSIEQELEILRADMAHVVITGQFQSSFTKIKDQISALVAKREDVRRDISTVEAMLKGAFDCLTLTYKSLSDRFGGIRDEETTGQQVEAESTERHFDRGFIGFEVGGTVSQSDSDDEESRGTTVHVFNTQEGGNVRKNGDDARAYQHWQKECYNCGQNNHATAHCPNALSTAFHRRSTYMAMLPCFNCCQLGHIANDCINPRKHRSFYCFFCYGNGHRTFDCPHMLSARNFDTRSAAGSSRGTDIESTPRGGFGRTNSDSDIHGSGRGIPVGGQTATGIGRSGNSSPARVFRGFF